MFKLKHYQAETLDTLRRFFEEARIEGPKSAYEVVTGDPEQSVRLGNYRGPYQALSRLKEIPYVCLRLPTGGGKTMLAAHAVVVARDSWVEKNWPMVLWLVPTKTIRRQTTEALRNSNHPYRRVLDESFDRRVRVFDIAEFDTIRPHDVRDNCCILVGTIQTLRVKSTEGRKVYAHNENLESHFTRVSSDSSGLELLEDGSLKFSLTNLMHLHQPLMIVDEAHNAVTGLTREMQVRVNPCAIVEFTATPRINSNILHSVTASELKSEEMIKLPVMLSEHDTWQEAVSGAVAARATLAEVATDDPKGIRPITLFQAQKRNEEVTVAKLKAHLHEVEQIPIERIAVATGDQRELDRIDLFDPTCRIEHVITVEALKEGWDCSFAYVFCSVSRIRSSVDVEQLLGRVLRMPYAKRRKRSELNRAYAFLSEPSFGEAARALVDKLIEMGFDEDEAHESIERTRGGQGSEDDLFSQRETSKFSFSHNVNVDPKLISDLQKLNSVTIRESEDGKSEIVISGLFDEQLERTIIASLPKSEHKAFEDAVEKYRTQTRKMLSPAERGESFVVPRLMSSIQGSLEFADIDVFMEYHDWSLLDHSWELTKNEFEIRTTARSFEIDLDGTRISYQFTSEDEQLRLDTPVEGWTTESLVLWLDRRLRQVDIAQSQMLEWLSQLVGYLVEVRGLHIVDLMRCKFILSRKIRDRIEAARQAEKEKVYQHYLFSPNAAPQVSFEDGVVLESGMYLGERRYRGRWKPNRHFLGPDQVPAFDGDEDGEEIRCAQAIDAVPGLKFWIRNVARNSGSFWLPTLRGKFYPDFVALLEDGRLLIVEYKGSHLAGGSDTAEKRTIGELWERTSNGACLFLLAEKSVNNLNPHMQILSKINLKPT